MRYFVLLASLISIRADANGVMLAYGDDQDEFDATKVKVVDPPPGLIEFVLKSEPDSQKQFSECLAAHGSAETDARTFFTVFELPLNDDASPDYFVRPAEEPGCLAFLGAHGFQYWFITSQRNGREPSYSTVLHGLSDGVVVLNTMTHGFHDLLLWHHTAVDNFKTTLKFDGQTYREAACSVDHWENGVVVGTETC